MSKGTIMIIDDEPDLAAVLEKRLSDAGFRVSMFGEGAEAISKLKGVMPDLILLDIMMPGMNGLEVKKLLNAEKETSEIPVIFLSSRADVQSKIDGLKLRAEDYVTKPYDFPELLARIDAAIVRKRHFDQIAMTDALTGLQNVYAFRSKLELFFDIAQRYGRVFSMSMIDVDDFKKINDTYGHSAGDEVLKIVAETMRRVFRKPDVLIRYGGDEFVILLPESNDLQASSAISRLKRGLEENEIGIGGDREIRISISVGIATYRKGLRSSDELFEEADKKMYEDKQQKKGPE